MELELSILSQSALPEICRFNTEIYPEKIISSDKYLNYWFSRSKDEISNSVFLIDENNNVYGQLLTSKMAYYYKGVKTDSVWLFDLIVDEALRKSAWGVDLILYCFQKFPNSCSIGSGPTALPIHLKLGNSIMGELRKYIGVFNPFWLISSIKRGVIPIDRFQSEVRVGSRTFIKITKDELPDLEKPYNDKLWEVSRDVNFLKWRYFNDLHDYAFYYDETNGDYFVLRTITRSHITVMVLVDYRCNVAENKNFEDILKAVSIIMAKLHLAFLLTGSSLSSVDSVLERFHFYSVGRPRPIIGFQNINDRKEDVAARNFAFVTLADSDGETNWI